MTNEVLRLEGAGIPILLRRNRAHEVVALRLYARGGSTCIDVSRAGADLFYARTARRGTRGFPKEILNAELARMGSDIGCHADEDLTVFHLRCLRRHFENSWKLFVDILRHPLLESNETELVRRQMLLGIRQRQDDPDGRLGDLAREQVFAAHPYAPHPEGTEDSVGSLTAEHLRQHAQARLQRANLLLVVVGDLEAPEVESRVRKDLGDLPAGHGPLPGPPPFQFSRSTLRTEARTLPTNYILGQFAAPSLADPEHAAAMMALSVLRDRLFEEVRTKRNLSYAPGAGLGSHAANLGWVYVTAVDPATTMRVIRDEMRRLCEEPMEAKELRDKVQVYITRYHLQNETHQAQAGFLARYELLGGGWERTREFVARLEALTPHDLQRSARSMLSHLQYAYLGDPSRASEEIFRDP
jgi:zinc protease